MVRMLENKDQNNSKYGHFLRSEGVLKKISNFNRKTSVLESLFNKIAAIFEKTPAQVFSC